MRLFSKYHASETNGYGTDEVTYLLTIDDANRIFNQWLDGQPVVYGQDGELSPWLSDSVLATKTAKLVDIQEIKKVECEHNIIARSIDGKVVNCFDCGAVLKPTTSWVKA